MDLCGPVRSEAVGDLAEDDRRTDFPLGNIVGRRDIAVGEEDEEFRPPGLDLFEQDLSGGVGDRRAHQAGQLLVGPGGIARQCRILEIKSSFSDLDGPSQRIADFWAKIVSPQSMTSFSASLSPMRGAGAIREANQITHHSATPYRPTT